jgi:arginyl-tRNA synthetase
LKFREFEDEVRRLLSSALSSLKYDADVDVEEPNDSSFGDLSSAVALRLAKKLVKKPAIIAQEIASKIQLKNVEYVESIEPHQSGYLNFRLKFAPFAADAIREVLKNDSVGSVDVGRGERLVIEHTNVNPNKALHIGHARNLVLGDSLARIMRHLGYDVKVLNYIDDSGSQVADIIVGFKFMGIDDGGLPGMKFDAYCGDKVYVRVNREYETNSALKEKQALVMREIEKGDNEIAKYTLAIVNRILKDQLATCWRLRSRYDLLNWETHILRSKMWEKIFARIKQKRIAFYQETGENKGCWVLTEPESGEEKVLVRSDGTAVYVAKDIPYAGWKIGLVDDPFKYTPYVTQPDGTTLWTTSTSGGGKHPRFGGAESAVSVIDSRQSHLQKIVAYVLEHLSQGASKRYLHRGYEVVALSKKTAASLGLEMDQDFVHMQGRKGIYINTDTIMDALKKKATEETKKRNPEEREDWVEEVAEAISVAALRFELVKQDPDKIIVFDLEEALRLEGETGPYLLYTYARARRIIEKSGESPHTDPEGVKLLNNPLERSLIKTISKLDKAVFTAGEYYSPKEVARYVYNLALLFNQFYESIPVNKEPNVHLRSARLALVDACSRIIRQSSQLIGINCPERI